MLMTKEETSRIIHDAGTYFNSAGYDIAQRHGVDIALAAMGDDATELNIVLNEYKNELIDMFESVRWLSENSEENARNFINSIPTITS